MLRGKPVNEAEISGFWVSVTPLQQARCLSENASFVISNGA
jgi:hypothetical protein